MAAGTKGKMAEQKKAGFAGRQTESLPARLLKDMRKNWILYVMILPVVVYYIIFAYAPIYGIQLAFKDYIVKKGIWGSRGLEWKISPVFSAAIISDCCSKTQ